MGVVLISKRELNRVDTSARLEGGPLTTAAAAETIYVFRYRVHLTNDRRGRRSTCKC
jgi:hypothetical protein